MSATQKRLPACRWALANPRLWRPNPVLGNLFSQRVGVVAYVGLLVLVSSSFWPAFTAEPANTARVAPLQPVPLVGGVSYNSVRANTLLHARKGEELMSLGKFAEAIDAFQVGVDLNPDSTLAASLYHNMALCYRALGQYPHAIKTHQRALRLAPGFKMYALHLALTYKAMGKAAQVRERFLRIQKDYPTDEVAILIQYLN